MSEVFIYLFYLLSIYLCLIRRNKVWQTAAAYFNDILLSFREFEG